MTETGGAGRKMKFRLDRGGIKRKRDSLTVSHVAFGRINRQGGLFKQICSEQEHKDRSCPRTTERTFKQIHGVNCKLTASSFKCNL